MDTGLLVNLLTHTPIGPVIETELDPFSIKIESYLNYTKKQDSPTEYMIFPIRIMLSYLSIIMTLYPGDVILTGAPRGRLLKRWR
jgi:2-keto-4-pentenoate hydratase/2-oxohepta-3-ene-1,7-dioic acid hydratase in catechol pathway